MPGDDLVRQRMGGPTTTLRHGRWILEVRGDEVADVRFDGVLLLRAIRPVVRDRDWNTVPVRVVQRRHPDGDAGVLETRLAFDDAEGIAYAATVTARLTDDELVVHFAGVARSGFERNRIGLVVLHPATDAGRDVVVRHPDGSTTAGRWPTAISPHQPFQEVAGFRWAKAGIDAELSLSGDVFETEDQRNWTDASFKTYSTPLSRGFPVSVEDGETCRQQARLRVRGRSRKRQPRPAESVTVGAEVTGRVPALALAATLYPPPASLPEVPGRYEAVLVELTGSAERWPALLAEAAGQASTLHAGLDVRIVTADPDAVRQAVRLLPPLAVRRLGVYDPDTHLTTEPLWTVLRDGAGTTPGTGVLVGGTRAYFTELNRGQAEIPADLPGLTFSLTPTMHATEVPHLLDSLPTQRTVVENALRIAGGRPLHVGPVTLARRFNAVATSGRPDPAAAARRGTDPLQDTDLAGVWTLASVAALAVPGVASLCYFETAGARGVRRDDGSLTPAGAVLEQVAALRGRSVLDVEVPEALAALPTVGSAGVEVLLGNLTSERRTVPVRLAGRGTEVIRIDPWSTRHLRLG